MCILIWVTKVFKISPYISICMLTQKTGPSERPLPKKKAEILVEGFVPSKEPECRFDIAPNFGGVVDYLKCKGFGVQLCADYSGAGFHGGDLSGTPFNVCKFDLFSNIDNPLQARLSIVLKILADTVGFRAQSIFRTEEPISRHASTLHIVYFSYERPDPGEALKFLQAAESAGSIQVEYSFRGGRGSFTI